MTTKDIFRFSQILNGQLQQNSDLINYIETISDFDEEYVEHFLKYKNSVHGNTAQTHNNVLTLNNSLKNIDGKVLAEVKEMRPRAFIKELFSLVNALEETKIFINNSFSLRKQADNIIELHTDAFSEKGTAQIFKFVQGAKMFNSELEKYIFLADIAFTTLSPKDSLISVENVVIDIEIDSENTSIHDFSMFLINLEELYKRLCRVYSVHYEDYPLKIIKIESGSIWGKLSGLEKIIDLIKDVIFGLAQYFRDVQTGKIAYDKLENKTGQSVLLLDLLEKAKQNDLKDENIQLLEKAINKSFSGLFNSLPKDTTEISVNDHKLMSLSSIEVKAIKGKERLRIDSPKDN